MNNSLRSVLGAELYKTLAHRSFTPGKPAYLFVNVSEDAVVASSATLSDAGAPDSNSLCRSLHSDSLLCSEEVDYVVIRSQAIHQHIESLFYSQPFITANDVSKVLSDLLLSGFYA